MQAVAVYQPRRELEMLHQANLHSHRSASAILRASRRIAPACALTALLALQATAAGCALTDHTVGAYRTTRTTPSARAERSVILDALEYTPTMESDPDAVGVKKNGYNTITAKLYTRNGPVAWLTDAVTAELGMAGIRLERDEGAAAPHLWITVTQFFVEPSMGSFTAELQAVTVADVEITFPADGSKYKRRFVGRDISTEGAATGDLLERRLLLSCQQALALAAEEIAKLLEAHQAKGETSHDGNA
jgi:hypothetical protein